MEKPIRVLQFGTGNFGRGGQSTIVLNWGLNMDSEKVIFDYFLNRISDEKYIKIIEKQGGKVYIIDSLKNNLCNKIRNVFYINKILKLNNYRIIHINTSNTFSALIIAILGKLNGMEKIIIHSHSSGATQNNQVLHKISKQLLSKIGTKFLACSEKAAEWLYSKKIKNEVIILKNGVNIDKYKFNLEKRIQLRKKMKLENKFIVGNIGRFSDSKNHEFLIKIFNEVQKIEKESILLLIGNGELEEKIKKQVKEIGLENNVIFLGNINNVEDYLQIMDVFCFPTKFEGLGIVAIEAQAAALKVIASDTVPEEAKLSDYLEYFSLDESEEEWAKKILKYKNTYKRKDMSEIIKEKGYSIKDSAKELEKIYLS